MFANVSIFLFIKLNVCDDVFGDYEPIWLNSWYQGNKNY